VPSLWPDQDQLDRLHHHVGLPSILIDRPIPDPISLGRFPADRPL